MSEIILSIISKKKRSNKTNKLEETKNPIIPGFDSGNFFGPSMVILWESRSANSNTGNLSFSITLAARINRVNLARACSLGPSNLSDHKLLYYLPIAILC